LFSNSIWKVGGLCALDAAPVLRELGRVAICAEFVIEFLFEDVAREPPALDTPKERRLLPVTAIGLLWTG
jgi:hypothetical protein